jgi:hypothetical protein
VTTAALGELTPHTLEHPTHGAQGHGDEDHVRTLHGDGRIAGAVVDDAEVEGELQVLGGAAAADDLADGSRAPQRPRERAADQADPDNRQPLDHAPAPSSRLRQRPLQRGEQALVLIREPDADAQVVRQPVVGHRPTDDALAQQGLIHRRRRAAQVDGDEVADGRNPAQPKTREPSVTTAISARLCATDGARDMVGQRGDGAAWAGALTLNGCRTRFISSATAGWLSP